MSEQTATSALVALSEGLAGAVERAGASVVRLEARRRQPASGVVWSADGLVVTADHILERDEDISVGLPDGRAVGATIVGRDPTSDLALLRAKAEGLHPIQHGAPPKVGHFALVVARPGEGLATSAGVISAIVGPVRNWRGDRLGRFIRTDVTFYPGFSGGPLVDLGGSMLGLATSRFSRGEGAGVAIPLDTVTQVVGALQSHGRIRRGFLGVGSQPVALPESLRSQLGLEQESGLLVVSVEGGGPAERGGLMIGDVLIALAGQPVRDTGDLRGLLGSERVGQATPVRVVRGGEARDLTVTIGERE